MKVPTVDVLLNGRDSANLTTDAHLAALAVEHGATLATFDGDFHRFNGLKLEYLGSGAGLARPA